MRVEKKTDRSWVALGFLAAVAEVILFSNLIAKTMAALACAGFFLWIMLGFFWSQRR